MQQGAFRFFEARTIQFPVRGLDNEPYYLASSEAAIKLFNDTAAGLGAKVSISLAKESDTVLTEFGKLQRYRDASGAFQPFVLADSKVFEDILNHLPVIARNSLDNGQSENLWYEEVLPRESRLYFSVLAPDTGTVDFETAFNKHLQGKTVQIGANATVGYGYCKISKIA
jgi:CRISPR/Cas system CMR subunit Cmr4 (Cas7 group RAMP superfamily)